MKVGLSVLACCFIGLAAGETQANVITFDEIAGYSISHFVSNGFLFKDTGYIAHLTRVQSCTPSCPVNGTQILLNPSGYPAEGESSAFVEMSAAGGGAFTLIGFDGAGAHNFNELAVPQYIPNQIDVVGTRLDGTMVTQSFLIDKSVLSGPLRFTTYTLSNSFVNLTSVTFSSSGSVDSWHNGLSLDNIVATLAPVPEPEIFAMLIAGLGFIGAASRRYKRP